MEEEYRKGMRNVEELDKQIEKKYGVKGTYTKQMESQIAIKEEYGVVESLDNSTINEAAEGYIAKPSMVIKYQANNETVYIYATNDKEFNIGDEVVYVTYLFNRPATKGEIGYHEFFYRVEGIKFVPVFTRVTYYARDYEQMKKNGGPKR